MQNANTAIPATTAKATALAAALSTVLGYQAERWARAEASRAAKGGSR